MIGAGHTDRFLDDGEVRAIVRAGLDSLAPDGKRLLFIVPDGTRTMPMPQMFALFGEFLADRATAVDYLIALGTQLGLTEIGAVRATNDHTEIGQINPDVQTHMAYNPDSEIIPTIRSNGVAYAQIVPGGSLICGRSCLLSLDAWTKEDATVKLETGLHVVWPRIGQSAERRGEYSSRKPRGAWLMMVRMRCPRAAQATHC